MKVVYGVEPEQVERLHYTDLSCHSGYATGIAVDSLFIRLTAPRLEWLEPTR